MQNTKKMLLLLDFRTIVAVSSPRVHPGIYLLVANHYSTNLVEYLMLEIFEYGRFTHIVVPAAKTWQKHDLNYLSYLCLITFCVKKMFHNI